ncbi:transducin beta-like protein 3 [Topomyia yanbarensis]|uniref:transducin beta-like protein 3 n=1 Tax=Topomyia yanbarensis TaxID=2498891 RepID=UPI00273CBB3D|nr:transducin beta-like protein 3 [Topomyia yanbarensis]XP_058815944.1 transducin beta-like protein 3 [Topomyia yanbarensis]
MSTKIKLKEVYEVQNQYKAFYTGGSVQWSSDGREILCQNSGTISLVSAEDDSTEPVTFGEANDEDIIYTFALSKDGKSIITAHRSGLLKLWNKESKQVNKMWRGIHLGPIMKLVFSDIDDLIASGGTDTTVRVWDPVEQVCKGTLRGCQGVINLLVFHPDANLKTLLAAGDDVKINAWNYETRELLKTFSGHFSKVTAVSFSNDKKFIVSSGRDKILILWNYETQEAIKTIPVYESIESVVVLPAGINLHGQKLKAEKVYAACAGEEGLIKVWEMTETKIIFKQSNSLVTKATEEGGLAVTDMLFNKQTIQLALVTADHNIIIHDIKTLECVKQLSGFSDEILDLILFGKKDRFLGMATNSNDFKVYDTSSMNCQLVKGHADIVLSLSANDKHILSSSKDNSIRLWSYDVEKFLVQCIAIGLKHTNAVGSVALSKISGKFCASVSQDKCLKVWKIPKEFNQTLDEREFTRLNCSLTELAHDKDINCVCISPNDQLIATGSQDKSAKLWDVKNLTLVGVFRGHRRGIWAVRFSPVDQILLTNAADCCIKLWSLTDMTCLKTLEGHESSVLKVEFLSNGMQLISAGADGLLKLWSIKSSECIQTMDKHENRIWAICVSEDESVIYSGGTDSQLIKWKDVTKEKIEREQTKRNEMLLQEQELSNLVNDKKLLKALRLSLNLDRPLMTLKIITAVIKSQEQGLADTVHRLRDDHKETLLKHAIEWNTNSKNCRPAQLILNILLQEMLAGNFHVSELNKHLEAALPYTERHFKRMTEYAKDLKFIEYTLQCMQPHAVTRESNKPPTV